MSEDEFLDFSDNGSDQFYDLPDMAQYYDGEHKSAVENDNMTPREEYKSRGLNDSEMSVHKRQKSRDNYGTAHNDMIMELPDEQTLESNTYIWSHTVSVGKRSFVDDRQSYQHVAPPPIYLDGQKLINHFHLPTDVAGILKGLE